MEADKFFVRADPETHKFFLAVPHLDCDNSKALDVTPAIVKTTKQNAVMNAFWVELQPSAVRPKGHKAGRHASNGCHSQNEQ
mgnify:CR=1 FL=1